MPLHLNKPGLRVLGIAESFVRSSPKSRLAGVVMRGDLRIDGIALSSITVSGDDATSGVLDICRQLDRDDINAILLSGAVISWFNIIDIQEVFDQLKIPLVCLTYEESPGLEKYIREYFPEPDHKLSLYHSLGERELITLKTEHSVYVRALGMDAFEARVLLNKFTLDGRIPEPLRVARLTARAALHSDLGRVC
ncbi:MAG TPA: DUF99 family protein [Methanotrichaceae archaeon]|nr:DUF99 family protein [Methanotrichaceae archaeon]